MNTRIAAGARFYAIIGMVLTFCAGSVLGQDAQQDTSSAPSDTSRAIVLDTTLAEPLDTSATAPLLDTLATTDTSATPPDTAVFSRRPAQPTAPKEETQKIKIIKRDFRFREQIGIAVGMMAFVAFMMITSQSWNPN